MVKGFSRFVESASKRIAGTATDLAIAGTGHIGSAGNWVANKTKPEIKGKWAVTRVLQRSVKYPFYWLTAGPAKTIGFLAGTAPKEIMSFTQDKVKNIHAGTLGVMNDTFEGANIRTITDILATFIDRGTQKVGEATSSGASMAYQALSTREKRQVFEELAQAHDEQAVANMLDATGLNAALNTDLSLGIEDHLGTTPYIGAMKNKVNADQEAVKNALDVVSNGLQYWIKNLNSRINIANLPKVQKKAFNDIQLLLSDIQTKINLPQDSANKHIVVLDTLN